MALASLLVRSHPKPTWAFEHAMAHRWMLGAFPPSNFSIVPYELDPENNHPAWHLNHGQAHTDALSGIAPGATAGPGQPYPTPLGLFGAPIPANHLVDGNLQNRERQIWWTFQNHHDHFISTTVLVGTQLTYPFG
jgi:hypothetical protein